MRTTPRSIAARRRPGDEDLAHDDQRDHPGRVDAVADEHHEHREDEHLVGDRVEQRAERRRAPARRASLPSNESVAIATPKSAVAQYAWPSNFHAKRRMTNGTEAAAQRSVDRRRSWVRGRGYGAVMFDTVLIANRGEIALRIIRALREIGLRTVAVYSEADRAAPHVAYADEAFLIGPPPAAESYLDVERIIAAARAPGAAGDPSGLRLPGRERGLRARLSRPPGSSGSGRRRRRSSAWAARPRRARDEDRRRADRSRHDRAGRIGR